MISVVLPTYNREHTLKRAIVSVLRQSYTNLELIVVDDGSTDDTPALVKSIDDARVRYLRLPENRGACAARNIGIHAARGPWVAFQDSDDEWLTGKLDAQLNSLMKHPNATVLFGSRIRFSPEGIRQKPPAHWRFDRDQLLAQLLRRSPMGTQAMIILRDALIKVGGFNENLRVMEEGELALRLLLARYRFDYCPHPLVFSYLQTDSISSNNQHRIAAARFFLSHYPELLVKFPHAKAEHLRSLGRLLCLEGNARKGRAHLFQALRLKPTDPALWATLVLSIGGGVGIRWAGRVKAWLIFRTQRAGGAL